MLHLVFHRLLLLSRWIKFTEIVPSSLFYYVQLFFLIVLTRKKLPPTTIFPWPFSIFILWRCLFLFELGHLSAVLLRNNSKTKWNLPFCLSFHSSVILCSFLFSFRIHCAEIRRWNKKAKLDKEEGEFIIKGTKWYSGLSAGTFF